MFKSNFIEGVQKGLGVAVVLTTLGLFALMAYTHWAPLHYRNAYMPKDGHTVEFAPPVQGKVIASLVSNGTIISANDLYNDTLSFYNTLITWLIGILGVNVLVGYFYVQSVSVEKAEKLAGKAVELYFQKGATEKELGKIVHEAVAVETEGFQKTFDTWEERLEVLWAKAQPDLNPLPPAGVASTPPPPPASPKKEGA